MAGRKVKGKRGRKREKGVEMMSLDSGTSQPPITKNVL